MRFKLCCYFHVICKKCISTSLSLPDRSQQLFGPCLLSSAFQHALCPCNKNRWVAVFLPVFLSVVSACHSLLLEKSDPWHAGWIVLFFFSPPATMRPNYHSSQGAVLCFSLPAAAACSPDRGAHLISSAVRRPWRQKLNSKTTLHSATQRPTV